MERNEIDRKFSFLLNEIAATSDFVLSLQNYKRVWLTVFITGVVATLTLEDAARWIALVIAAYSLIMIIEVGLRARRASRIEGALRCLALRSEFGILDAEEQTKKGVMAFVGQLIAKRREIWSAEAALQILEGDKDLGAIIESGLGLSKEG